MTRRADVKRRGATNRAARVPTGRAQRRNSALSRRGAPSRWALVLLAISLLVLIGAVVLALRPPPAGLAERLEGNGPPARKSQAPTGPSWIWQRS